MKLNIVAKIISVCFIFISSAAYAAEPSLALQQWINAEMQQYHVVGASIAVVKNYKITWAKGFGYADKNTKRVVDVNTLFQAASISKPISAVAALEIFQQQHLSIDTNINLLLKSWKIPSNIYTKYSPITLRLLLSHSSGITGFRFKGYLQNQPIPTLLEVLNGMPPANTPPIIVVRHPDAKYEYCPAGYAVLQQLLMDMTHQSFSALMQNLILNPMGMTHSTFEQPLPQKYFSQMALPYLPDGTVMPNGPATFIASAAGGLWTTPTDLAQFLIAIQNALKGESQGNLTQQVVNQLLSQGVDHNMGVGMEINIDKYGVPIKTTGDYFRHSGFNSNYLSMLVGSEHDGNGVVIMINTAPDMSTKDPVVQYDFIANTVKKISETEGWR